MNIENSPKNKERRREAILSLAILLFIVPALVSVVLYFGDDPIGSQDLLSHLLSVLALFFMMITVKNYYIFLSLYLLSSFSIYLLSFSHYSLIWNVIILSIIMLLSFLARPEYNKASEFSNTHMKERGSIKAGYQILHNELKTIL